MKNGFLAVMIMILMSLPVMANDAKLRVAIFDPIINSENVENEIKSSIREIITSTVVNSGKYNAVERSLLEKVFKEQEFTNSGIVDDSNAVEIGKLTGANKVVVSLLSPSSFKGLFKGSKTMFSIKIIDVQTANIDKQKVKEINMNDWLNEVSSITEEMVSGQSTTNKSSKINDMRGVLFSTAPQSKNNTESEFTLHLASGYTPDNYSHKDNYIEVKLNGDVVGGGTLSEGFDIKIKEKKHKKYKLEIIPTSTSDDGKIDMKSGKMVYNIDTNRQQNFEFMIQSQRKGKWTVYTVRLR